MPELRQADSQFTSTQTEPNQDLVELEGVGLSSFHTSAKALAPWHPTLVGPPDRMKREETPASCSTLASIICQHSLLLALAPCCLHLKKEKGNILFQGVSPPESFYARYSAGFDLLEPTSKRRTPWTDIEVRPGASKKMLLDS